MKMNESDYFKDYDEAYKIYIAVLNQIKSFGDFSIKTSKSQIALKTKRTFAIFWIPEKYLKKVSAKLVLSIPSKNKYNSSDWKEVYEPFLGRFIHHLEIKTAELDKKTLEILKNVYEETKQE